MNNFNKLTASVIISCSLLTIILSPNFKKAQAQKITQSTSSQEVAQSNESGEVLEPNTLIKLNPSDESNPLVFWTQAILLSGLESRDIEDWNFAVGGTFPDNEDGGNNDVFAMSQEGGIVSNLRLYEFKGPWRNNDDPQRYATTYEFFEL